MQALAKICQLVLIKTVLVIPETFQMAVSSLCVCVCLGWGGLGYKEGWVVVVVVGAAHAVRVEKKNAARQHCMVKDKEWTPKNEMGTGRTGMERRCGKAGRSSGERRR